MQRIHILLLGSAIAFLSQSGVTGQFVDAITGPNIDTLEEHLYLHSGQLAPVGTEIWFVADGGAAGVPTGQVSQESIAAIAAGTADDKRFFSGSVDGTDTIVDLPGRFQQSHIAYDAANQGKPTYVYLWSDSHGGDVGDTFGLLELTTANGRIVPGTGLGNFQFLINSDIVADTFTVVPEPSQSALVLGFLCLAGAALRAYRSKRLLAA